MAQDQMTDEMLLQAQRHAAQQIDLDIQALMRAMDERNLTLKSLVSELQNETYWDRQTALRSEIDALNAQSQTDMIQIQSLVNKRNQALDMLTNLQQKFQKTLDSIVRNMR
ncbi:MAG: hypothetical protein JO261_11995 [Alphaproteobacteria bacterium]|nr:hypothetical protein [Alphaproteobacteria bacterium]